MEQWWEIAVQSSHGTAMTKPPMNTDPMAGKNITGQENGRGWNLFACRFHLGGLAAWRERNLPAPKSFCLNSSRVSPDSFPSEAHFNHGWTPLNTDPMAGKNIEGQKNGNLLVPNSSGRFHICAFAPLRERNLPALKSSCLRCSSARPDRLKPGHQTVIASSASPRTQVQAGSVLSHARWRLSFILLLACVQMGSAAILNPSFETGFLDGWTRNDFPVWWTQKTSGWMAYPGFFAAQPTDGNFVADHPWDGPTPGTARLYQETQVPAGTPVLTFDFRAAWDLTWQAPAATVARTFKVTIEPQGGGTALASKTFLTANPGTRVTDSGATNGAYDLSAYAGTTVRVCFDLVVPEAQTGPAFFQLDNVAWAGGGLPSLSINNVTVTEGDSGTVNAVFTVSLSATNSQTVTVDFLTTNGTATAGSDYATNSGTLTFNPGETSQTITVVVNGDTAVEPNETFFVLLSNPANATLAVDQGTGTIQTDDAAPSITAQPQSQTVAQGSNATFTVTAIGSAPLSYQWRLNGVSIAGATNVSLTLTNVQLAWSGHSYDVVVTNAYDSITSQIATLTVLIAPSIVAQPFTRTATNGATVTFTVSAGGSGPLASQWRKNGTNIPGATAVSLVLNNVSSADEAAYSVLVTNAVGSVVSQDALFIRVAQNPPPFLDVIGTGTGTEVQFNVPNGVAVDKTGHIYVADQENYRIVKLDSDGAFIRAWGRLGQDNGEFFAPSGICFDESGNVVVTDAYNNRVQKFDKDGNFLTAWGSFGTGDGQFNSSWGVAIDAADNVYVAEQGNHRIQKFTSNGTFLLKWGSFGTGDGQFNQPQGPAVDSSGNVYIADRNNNRVQKFTSDGVFLAKWGSAGNGNGQFSQPIGVTIDGSGHVFVAEIGGHRIQEFDPAGNYLSQWGSFGMGDTQFNAPSSIAVDDNGNIYVTESRNHLLKKFTNTGGFLAKWGSGDSSDGHLWGPSGVTVDAQGFIYIAERKNHRIQKFDTAGNFVVKWGTLGTASGQFNNPTDVGLDSAGNVYVVDQQNFRIQKFSNTGAFIAKWGASGTGNGQFKAPCKLALDGYDNVYVTEASSNERIQKFNAAGAFITKWGSSGNGPGQFTRPGGITVDSAGMAYVSDSLKHRIQKFDGSGNYLSSWGAEGNRGGELYLPMGMASTSTDDILVADSENDRIVKSSSTGALLTLWGALGSGTGQFNRPCDVAVDAQGFVYVADTDNNRIQRFGFATPPSITAQVQSLAVVIGDSASFSVSATSTLPLAYQWRKNGVNLVNGGAISGAQSSTMTINPTAVSDSGNYDVGISNVSGSVTSIVATLSVTLPTLVAFNQGTGIISKSPDQSSYSLGQTVTLTAAPGLYYGFSHWLSNGVQTVSTTQYTVTIGATNIYTAVFTSSVPLEWRVSKQWESVFGGTDRDWLAAARPTSDGGFLLGGNSASGSTGNKTAANFGAQDLWLVKIDSTGTKVWERVYGGPVSQALSALEPTPDGGFMAACLSYSGTGGNKTSGNSGSADFWILKLDANGDKQWERSYGGASLDYLTSARHTADGGYVLGGYSDSGIGGSKTTAGFGDMDYWVVKLDANGDKQWDRTFGGSGVDYLAGVRQTVDGGFLLAGQSLSGVSGNKTSASLGLEDFWAIKLDANGNKLWERVYGGNSADYLFAVEATADGGFLLAGNSYSGISGTKTKANVGAYDMWVVRLDANGNQVADYIYGGPNSDAAYAVTPTPDGGFVLAGNSFFGAGGHKAVAGYGSADAWAVKADALGNLQWEQVFGGTSEESFQTVLSLGNGDFLFGGPSASDANGNKQLPGFGTNDFWVVRVKAIEIPFGIPVVFVNGQVVPGGDSITVSNSASVELQSTLTNKILTYTLDGSDPGNSGTATPYTGTPFTVTSNVMVRALAINTDNGQRAESGLVTINVLKAFLLTTGSPGGGSVTPLTGSHLSNTVVNVAATPSNNWSFLHWTNDASGTANPVSVTVDRDKSVQAIFGTTVNTLVLNGSGTFALKPAAGPYSYGSTVSITAIPSAGQFLNFWGGATSGSVNPLDFVVTNGTPTVSAFFSTLPANEYALTVVENGGGTVARSPLANKYASGSEVTLTANAQAGHVFSGWSGDLVGAISPTQIVMDASKVITATFTPNTPPTVTLVEPANGQEFIIGTPITLSATASDVETSVQRVEFLTNGVLLASVANAPYSFTWNNAPLGSHVVTARSFDTLGTASTNATANITVQAIAPSITVQPLDVALLAGSNAVFNVSATGTVPLSYQWYKSVVSGQWSVVSGGNNPQLSILNTQPSDAGSYQVVVTNFGGSVTSSVARLRVVRLDNIRADFWVTDGPVHAVAQTNGVVYVGGQFQHVAPMAGGAAVTDGASGVPVAGWPRVNGKVHAAVSDGGGGWYIGGDFTQVGALPRTRLAHLLADRTVDPNWAPTATGAVEALALGHGRLYVGGGFANVSGNNRNGLAALDPVSGQVLAWYPAPNASAQVYAIAVAGADVYVGGSFTTMGGASRANLARLSGTVDAGTAMPGWVVDAESTVNAIVVSGGTVYLGGEFQQVRGVERRKLAAVSEADGNVLPGWNPAGSPLLNASDRVNALAVAGTRLIVGGRFNGLRGSPRVGLGAVELGDGAVAAWNPAPSSGATVSALAVSGDTVYAGGVFSSVDGQLRSSVAALSLVATTSGTYRLPWHPNANGEVRALAVQGGEVFVGGDFKVIGRVRRSNLAAFDAVSGAVLAGWDPGADNAVEALAVAGGTVYAGGAFQQVGGNVERNRLAAFDAVSGAVLPWNPNADGFVYALVVEGGRVYAGGTFGNVGGGARAKLAALNADGLGEAASWTAEVTGNAVYALALGGTNLYVGGQFTHLANVARNNLGAVNTLRDVNNVWPEWNPSPNQWVEALVVAEGVVYAGGYFSQIGGQARNCIAALDGMGAATSWAPDASGYVTALAASEGVIYAGGQFTGIGRQARSNFALVDNRNGDAAAFNAPANQLVRHLAAGGGTVFVGGDFTSFGGQASAYFAVMGPEGPPVFLGQPQNLTANGGAGVTLTAAVLGRGPLFYQWLHAGTNLAGANGPALDLPGLQTSHSGSYSLIVSNVIDGRIVAVTNEVATLQVVDKPPPPETSIQVGTDVTLTANASGSGPLSFQWRLNGQWITNNVANLGITVAGASSTLVITNAQPANSGSYLVTVRNPYGASDSAVMPVLVSAPANRVTLPDQFAARLAVSGTSGYVAGHNSGASVELPLEPQHAGRPGGASVWVKWVAPDNGVATFSTTGSGLDTLLAIYATNNPADPGLGGLRRVASDDDSGGFGTSKVSFNATNGVEYAVAVDGFGGATNHIVLSWNLELVNDDVPVIVDQPRSRTVTNETETVTFRVEARNREGNTNNITYQWRHHGEEIPGATNATLTIQVSSAVQNPYASYVCDVFIGGRKDRTYPAVLERNETRRNGVDESSASARSKDKFDEVFEREEGATPQGKLAGRRTAGAGGFGLIVGAGTTGTQVLGNIGSTRELFEPIIGSTGMGASRWFVLTAQSEGTLVVDTLGSQIDAVMTVWKFDATTTLSTLGRPEATDRNSAGDGTNALVAFTVQTGQSYLVAVDSENGVTGQIKLNFRMGQPVGISQHPASVTVNRLEQATFSVAASGEPVPAYQWRHNGVDLTGRTNATLTLTDVALADAGSYSVIVSNLLNVSVSGAAQLVVTDVKSWFAPPTLLSGAGLRLQGYSPFNQQVIIQATTNLAEVPVNWVPLHTNDGTLGLFDFIDTNAPSLPRRFYRSVRDP